MDVTKRSPSSALLVVAAALAHAFWAAPAAAGDPAAGRVKAAQACATCHGPAGISQVPDAPHLAGQPEIYLFQQLKNYREGKRRHEVMEIVVRPLKDSDMEDLAAWYASFRLKIEPP